MKDRYLDTLCIKITVFIWWSVRNQQRTLRRVRNLRVKVVFHFVKEHILKGNRLIATVEVDGKAVVVEVNRPDKDADGTAPMNGIFVIALL